jgi:hypothetical protein
MQRISEEEEREIVRLTKAGYRPVDIYNVTGVHFHGIQNVRKRYGLADESKRRTKKTNAEKVAEVLEEYQGIPLKRSWLRRKSGVSESGFDAAMTSLDETHVIYEDAGEICLLHLWGDKERHSEWQIQRRDRAAASR